MYKLNPKVDTSGVDSLTLFEFPPAGLVELFGDACDSDGFKISRKHVFTSDRGDIFTVYDWKQTTLYRGAHSGAPTPEEFWRSREPKPLRVGGRLGSNPRPFLRWLQAQYELRAATRRAGQTADTECL
ncbi:MAG TPA: hypothetical protein PLU87_09180 [Sedimentisphaerales bacterium]|mgnify:CR=1 FL=1|nr:hypothetical protein [Sedimentisphaerales bacterium]HRS11157.1 hypothetical protein [Sedimentisphaerales bacterium]HRV47634.1 hypothetical protein [Sedimentisphaerales bacterium]